MPLQLALSGLAMGCIYGLVALGYVFIWNSMRIINFAQGEFLMFAAYVFVATFVLRAHLGFLGAFLATGAVMGLLGALFSRTVYSRLRTQSPLVAIIATVGLGVVLKEAARLLYGPEPLFYRGSFGGHLVVVGGLRLSAQALLIILVTSVLVVLQSAVFRWTYAGKTMRAVALDPETAQLMGVPVDRVLAVTFAYTSVLAALAGVLLAPLFFVTTEMGTLVGLKGFVAMIIGGFGSVPGALVGGVLLGVAETLGTYFLSSTYKDAIAFLLMITFLALRPEGIFPEVRGTRA